MSYVYYFVKCVEMGGVASRVTKHLYRRAQKCQVLASPARSCFATSLRPFNSDDRTGLQTSKKKKPPEGGFSFYVEMGGVEPPCNGGL